MLGDLELAADLGAGAPASADFAALRRHVESAGVFQGIRGYITVLRLIARHSIGWVAATIERALLTGKPSPDVVAMYPYCARPRGGCSIANAGPLTAAYM